MASDYSLSKQTLNNIKKKEARKRKAAREHAAEYEKEHQGKQEKLPI
jgi:hypothetical protein